jgi:Fic family protein
MRIITRIVGSKKYFYLQHSFRRDGEVVTKEKYLGTAVPKNIDTLAAAFREELHTDIHKKLRRVRAHFQKEWKRLPSSVQEREKEQIAIAFTYNTNAIEGSTITLEETRELIQEHIAPNKPLRDVKETEAHNRVFLTMLAKKEKITEALLLRWHRDSFGETKADIAGKYREYLVRVGDYVAPDWQDVKKLMKELILFIRNTKGNAVEKAARAHYRFERIHPFGDGNGRIGRLLMNRMLWYAGYPMLIIEYKKRKSYYKALTKGEEGFVNYFLRRYLAVHKKRFT